MIGSNRDEMAFFTILEKVPVDLTEVGAGLLLRAAGLNTTQVRHTHYNAIRSHELIII